MNQSKLTQRDFTKCVTITGLSANFSWHGTVWSGILLDVSRPKGFLPCWIDEEQGRNFPGKAHRLNNRNSKSFHPTPRRKRLLPSSTSPLHDTVKRENELPNPFTQLSDTAHASSEMIRSESRRSNPRSEAAESYWNPGDANRTSGHGTSHDSGIASAVAIELGPMSLHRISTSTVRSRSRSRSRSRPRSVAERSTAKPPSVAPPNISVFDHDDDDDDREYLSGLKLLSVVVSVCLVMFLSLLDSSIVATAVSMAPPLHDQPH